MKIELSPRKRKLQEYLRRSNKDRDEWRRLHGEALVEIERLRGRIGELEAAEPSAAAHCGKVRLHSRFEAEAWLLGVARRTGNNPADYQPYRCKTCPEHPLIGTFWHIGHSVPSWKRALKEKSA